MRSRWLVLAGLVAVLGIAQAQSFQEVALSLDSTGRYTATTTFNHPAPAGFADTVFFAAPIDGALSIELAFLPLPGLPADDNFFQHVDIDGVGGSVSGQQVSLGPLTIAAGPHSIDIFGAATIPHGVLILVPPAGDYSVSIVLAAITPAVPEPRTWVLLLGGLAAGAFLARRARRS